MTDDEGFEGLKRELVDENEQRYGAEMRERYGDETVDEADAKLMDMTEQQYAKVKELQRRIESGLREAMATGDATAPAAHAVADLHRQWICCFWKDGSYSPEAHMGLAEMYLADDRFRSFYDAIRPGAAQFLHDAIVSYCERG